MEDNFNYIELITRYFSGEATEKEMQTLAEWLKSAQGNRKIFEEYRRTWFEIEGHYLDVRINPDQEWVRFSEKIDSLPSTPQIISFSPFFSRTLKIAAIVLLFLIPAFLIYQYFATVQNQKILAELSVKETTLPDGTVVTLNAGSTLEFPEEFTQEIREVRLLGEAYFEVKPDTSKPFIVTSGNVRVMVLGTAFNVDTQEQKGSMEVVLSRGKVSVYFAGKSKEQTVLAPGEMAEIFKDQSMIRKNLNMDENYMAWKTKKLVFTNKSLGIVVQDINNMYHSDIRLMNPDLASCRLTATFDHQTLESILNVLRSTLDISITRTGSTVEINGHGCE